MLFRVDLCGILLISLRNQCKKNMMTMYFVAVFPRDKDLA